MNVARFEVPPNWRPYSAVWLVVTTAAISANSAYTIRRCIVTSLHAELPALTCPWSLHSIGHELWNRRTLPEVRGYSRAVDGLVRRLDDQ